MKQIKQFILLFIMVYVTNVAYCVPQPLYTSDLTYKNVKTWYSVKGNSSTDDYSGLNTANTNSHNRTLFYPAGTYVVNSDLAFDSSVSHVFEKGAKLRPASGKIVTINGSLDCKSTQQCFDISAGGAVRLGRLAQNTPISPCWWGATGDGSHDDYPAIKAMTDAVDELGGGNIVYPPGNYYAGQYRITGGTNINTVTNFIYAACNGLKISGYGAKITVKGNFNRSNDYTFQSIPQSYRNTVVPFLFQNCNNVTVEGFELYGQVDLMTKDANVAEGTCSAINTQQCKNMLFQDMYIHHFAEDGLLIGYGYDGLTHNADRNITLRNVRVENCARDNMSVVQIFGMLVENCSFKGAGLTNLAGTGVGSYGAHDPQAGVDVEPEETVLSTTSPVLPNSANGTDINSANVTFLRCTMRDNVTWQFVSTRGGKMSNLTLKDCSMYNDTSTSPYVCALALCNGIIDGGYYEGFEIAASWPVSDSGNVRTTIKNAKIKTYGNGIAAVDPGFITIDNNEIVGTFTSPMGGALVPAINSPGAIVTNNRFVLPSGGYTGTGGMCSSALRNVLLAKDNKWETDLTPGATSQHFFVDYGGALAVEGEQFLKKDDHTVVTTTFRPAVNSTWDNTFPYTPFGTLNVTGLSTLANLTVSGTSTFTGNSQFNGSLGIGSAPTSLLDVRGAASSYGVSLAPAASGFSSGWTGLTMGSVSTAAGEGTRINSTGLSSGGNVYDIARMSSLVLSRGSTTIEGALAFYTHTSSNANPTERMRIDNLGNVGIGTPTPSAGISLDVNGTIRGTAFKLTNTGTFTCAAASTTTVSNTSVTASSIILLSPTNAAAGTLMGSVKSLYVSSISAGVSFTMATASTTAALGTETFSYVIIN